VKRKGIYIAKVLELVAPQCHSKVAIVGLPLMESGYSGYHGCNLGMVRNLSCAMKRRRSQQAMGRKLNIVGHMT
jgi:hypothetical protein